eukprot:3442200-Rhodomonas_salina.1
MAFRGPRQTALFDTGSATGLWSPVCRLPRRSLAGSQDGESTFLRCPISAFPSAAPQHTSTRMRHNILMVRLHTAQAYTVSLSSSLQRAWGCRLVGSELNEWLVVRTFLTTWTHFSSFFSPWHHHPACQTHKGLASGLNLDIRTLATCLLFILRSPCVINRMSSQSWYSHNLSQNRTFQTECRGMLPGGRLLSGALFEQTAGSVI